MVKQEGKTPASNQKVIDLRSGPHQLTSGFEELWLAWPSSRAATGRASRDKGMKEAAFAPSFLSSNYDSSTLQNTLKRTLDSHNDTNYSIPKEEA